MYEDTENAPTGPPRMPSHLPGLLRYVMQITKGEDARGTPNPPAMDEERRRFLEEALANLTVDMSEVMRGAINTLCDVEKIRRIMYGAEVPADVQKAFDTLSELVEDIDVAKDLFKLGGFTIFPVCFGCENESVRALASKLLGDVCQNNPFCQQKAMDCGLIKIALTLVQSETGNALARAIYALSCTCRDYPPGCRLLIEGAGCETLVPLLANPGPASTKAAFLVRYLCQNYPEARERFIRRHIVRTIAFAIKCGRTPTSEHLLSILLLLMEDRPPAVAKLCMERHLALQDTLERHLAHEDLVGDDFLEEKEYTQQLLAILKECPFICDDEEEVDR